MNCKISVTTKCNATCRTCPVWELPGQDMLYEDFVKIWEKVNNFHGVTKILLNNTGDMYNHPDRMLIFRHIEENKKKYVVMTTNAGEMDYIPAIDELIISFNGGNKDEYEYTTGLSFSRTVQTIKNFYPDFYKLKNLEMHVLVWEGNKENIHKIHEVFDDFPGKIRLSYKYDNQQKEDYTLPEFQRKNRIECDYLDMLNIWPDGRVIMCAHDFKGENVFGNVLTQEIEEILHSPQRMKKKFEHAQGLYVSLCANCNYNTPTWGKFKYIKE
jgi:radical SAM protein with 4Fe4S-binding SPASM domain